MTCEHCGRQSKRLILHEKELWCSPCHDSSVNPTAAVFRDAIPGGLWIENAGPVPVKFYSHSERRAYNEAHGLRELEKFCPMPGTDIDPQGIPNPKGYLDPQTLKNAAELISRNGAKADFDGVRDGVLRNLTTETVEDAQRMRDALNTGQ